MTSRVPRPPTSSAGMRRDTQETTTKRPVGGFAIQIRRIQRGWPRQPIAVSYISIYICLIDIRYRYLIQKQIQRITE